MMKLLISLILLVVLMAGPSHSWMPSSVITSTRSQQRCVGLSSSNDDSADDMAASMVHTGTVKWFDTTKGFGFIVPSDGSSDVFVHQTEIQMQGYRSLADGETVEYRIDVDPSSGRRKATRVTGPGGAPTQGAPFRPASDFESY